jgi:hypothetical protein
MQRLAIAFIASFFLAGTSWLFYSVSLPSAGAAELEAAAFAEGDRDALDDDGDPPDAGDPADAGDAVDAGTQEQPRQE